MLAIHFLLSLALLNVALSDQCYFNNKCAYQLYSSKTPYDTVRGDIRDFPRLEGCEPISIWSLHRHGNRNPGSTVTTNIKSISTIKDQIIASWESGQSRLCAQDIDAFRKWTWNDTMDVSASYLTATGYEELYDLAQRIRQQYPQVLSTTDASSLYFRPTNEQRTITSAMAFAHGLTDGMDLNVTIDDPWSTDMVIRPYAFCDRYQLEIRSENSLGDQQIEEFMNSPEYTAVQEAVQRRLGITHQLTRDEVYYLYELCRFYRSWETTKQSPWCSVFSDEELVELEYRDDIRHYYRNGYASWINVNLGRPAVKDMYESFEAVVQGGGRRVVSYFSHDTILQMVFAALDLYKDPFTLVGAKPEPNRLWRTSYIAPFSTNLVAVLNRCEGSSHRVQIFINEKESPLCPLSGCTWAQFQEKFQPYTNASTDFCNLNYTGEIPQPPQPPQPNSAVTRTNTLGFVLMIVQLVLLVSYVY